MTTISGFDSSTLLSYYSAKQTASLSRTTSSSSASTVSDNSTPPWSDTTKISQESHDAQVLSASSIFDLSDVPTHASTDTDKLKQDNQKLFALYQAVNTLAYMASMSKRDGMTSGQLTGFDTRFQAGLAELRNFISSTTFNNFTLQPKEPASSVTASISIPLVQTNYTGSTLAKGDAVLNALPNVSATDSFTVSVTKGGTKTDVDIDLSQIEGDITLDKVVSYVNQQLSDQGFSTRFRRVLTGGSINDPDNAKWGISIQAGGGESLNLSSASAKAALYVVGSSGSASGTDDVDPDQQGRLIKLTNLDNDPTSVISKTVTPTSGNTTGSSTVVDTQGNVYVLGNATGDFKNQYNQGDQDVYLTKYDSAGNLEWQQLLGSASTADGYAMALDPSGGIVVAGSTTSKLTTTAIADGNNDSFVAKYGSDGSQKWVKQLPTLAENAAYAVSVDASGNVYLGGTVTGVVGSGQAKVGGADAYIARLDSKGAIVSENQFGTAGADQVSAMTVGDDGSLYVASVQDGHAIVAKYANGDITSDAVWQKDLGDLQTNGSIGAIAIKGSDIYVAGTTRNAALDAGGEAGVAVANSGSLDSFVMHLSDAGASVTADAVSYVGTAGKDSGNGLTIGSDGTVYLTGSTYGTFDGQTRTVDNTSNLFVSALNSDGTVAWTKQYGGASGQSTGASLAIDPNGSSVLDALGLPRGDISVDQSVSLTQNTTLRAGDTFSIQFNGTGKYTAKVTIAEGETLSSLKTKINTALIGKGKATVVYGGGGKTLKIEVNPGVSATLVAGADGFDALSRLGIDAGIIAQANADGSPAATSEDSASQTFGLGLSSKLSIAATTTAGSARANLLTVLQKIRDVYRTTNAPEAVAAKGTNNSGTAPAYLTQQIASYSTALSALSSLNSSGGSSTSSTLGLF